jgi:class 3 adenylate cyclase/energy-coupling factor transporter ATP-binding protein EcfA2
MQCPTCAEPVKAGWRFCPACGAILMPDRAQEQRRVAVLFVDLVASTKLAKSYGSEEYFDLMGEILTVLAGEIEALDGHVVQFQGDAVLAAFGLTKTHPDDAVRALRAAKSCLSAIETYGTRVGLALEGRAGIDTDIATTGWVGKELTLFGNVVNLSRRLSSAAEPGEVLVSERIRDVARGQAQFMLAHSRVIRDYSEERGPYRLVNFKVAKNVAVQTPFQGRRNEMRWLENLWSQAQQVGLVQAQIIGPTGVGKSRLLQEFTQALEQEVRCITLYAKQIKLEDDSLDRLSEHEALVIVLESAEQFSLEMLDRLAVPSKKPRLILHHRRSALLPQKNTVPLESLRLNGFGFIETRALLESLGGPQPISLVQRWLEISAGNPWLLERLGRTALEPHFQADALPLPESVSRAVLERLDELPRSARETLSAAALFSDGVFAGALEAILNREVSADIEKMVFGGWLTELSPSAIAGETEFVFSLPIVRQIATTLTPLKGKKLLHFGLAVWFLERDASKARNHMRLSNEVTPSRVRMIKHKTASSLEGAVQQEAIKTLE